MKIRSFSFREITLPLIHGYRIAGHSITSASNFIVRVETDTGIVGYGCAAPADDVTGETDETCREALRGPLQQALRNTPLMPDPSVLGRRLMDATAGAPAACAAADVALWDIAAQAAELPLVSFLGGTPTPLPTSVTIGIHDVAHTVAEARQWLAAGFNTLKIKTGDDVEMDIERLHKLREAISPIVVLRVDANGGYDLECARRFLAATSDLNIELLEQPLACTNLHDARELVDESEVPIVADESVVSIADCERVIDERAAHGINIKLMKCGGICAARAIHDIAHAAGVSLMLGCNDETRISIAAALHFAQAMPGVRYVDLDGHMDLAKDPSIGGFTIVNGMMHTMDRPGLGISIDY